MKKICLFALFIAGCGGGYTPAPNPGQSSGPTTQHGTVTGQYDVILTSSNGQGTRFLYTNFTQTSKSLAGSPNVVCQGGDPTKCVEDDQPGVSITTTGTLDSSNISLTVSLSSVAGANTISVTGTLSGPGQDINGTYADTLGDSGTFMAFPSGTFVSGSLTGHFNSTAHPLSIAPMISISLAKPLSADFHLTGSASISNYPCISSLALAGEQVGDALELSDDAAKVHFLMIPGPTNFIFSYQFDQSAPSCAGDFGQGSIDGSPWDYVQPAH